MNLGRHALMDDLLREFLTETGESLDTVDNQLVRFEQDPTDAKILDNIFRLVHTIKGTCGFVGLPRLEALAHAGETLMGKFRDGMPVTAGAVTLILSSIDRIKEILAGLFDGVRTLTANIVLEMGYAADLHREALIGTAVVLFVFILIINLSFSALKRKSNI